MRNNCLFLHPTDPAWAQAQPSRRQNSDVVGQIPIPTPYPFSLTNIALFNEHPYVFPPSLCNRTLTHRPTYLILDGVHGVVDQLLKHLQQQQRNGTQIYGTRLRRRKQTTTRRQKGGVHNHPQRKMQSLRPQPRRAFQMTGI
jgi:hypothetical protein